MSDTPKGCTCCGTGCVILVGLAGLASLAGLALGAAVGKIRNNR